jgi:hypothetical protein
MEHLEGNPQGPSLSFPSVSGCSFVLGFVVGVFFAASFFFSTAAPSPLVALPSSQAKLTLEMAVPKLSP